MVKVLVFGMYEEAMYHPLTGVIQELEKILPDFKLDVTNQIQALCSAGEYDAVISYWDDWKEPIPDREAEALLQYVEQGGALLVLHNGISLQLQDAFRKVIGGKFITHPAQEAITFVVKDSDMTKRCGNFTLVEEPYQLELVEDGKEIILTYLYQGKEYPAGWRKQAGKGRVVYLVPGHTAEKFQCPEYRQLIRNSMEWLLQKSSKEAAAT